MSTSSESLAWIADHYGVPARRGQHIRFAGALARITGASGPHLRARMLETCRWAEEGRLVNLHPTWEIEWTAPTTDQPAKCDAYREHGLTCDLPQGHDGDHRTTDQPGRVSGDERGDQHV